MKKTLQMKTRKHFLADLTRRNSEECSLGRKNKTPDRDLGATRDKKVVELWVTNTKTKQLKMQMDPSCSKSLELSRKREKY